MSPKLRPEFCEALANATSSDNRAKAEKEIQALVKAFDGKPIVRGEVAGKISGTSWRA
jgi:hypothetical protein